MPRTSSKKHTHDLETPPVADAYIQPWDLDVFRWLHEVRLANAEQIERRFGRSKRTTQGRLKRLSAGRSNERWLERIRGNLADEDAINPPWIYALAPRGATKLIDRGEFAKPKLEAQRKSQAKHVAHTITTTEFLLRVQLECDATNGRVRYVPKDELLAGSERLTRNLDKQLTLRARIPTQYGTEWATTVPDGVFQLDFSDHRKRPVFFLETDMGWETGRYSKEAKKKNTGRPQSEVYRKYQVYESYWRSGLCQEEFPFRNFYVLFLTDVGEQRVLNTIQKVRDIFVDKDGSKPGFRGWLFSNTNQIFGAEDILSAEWRRGDGSFGSLTPEIQSSARADVNENTLVR